MAEKRYYLFGENEIRNDTERERVYNVLTEAMEQARREGEKNGALDTLTLPQYLERLRHIYCSLLGNTPTCPTTTTN